MCHTWDTCVAVGGSIQRSGAVPLAEPSSGLSWDDGALTLDEEGSWIPPTLLVPRLVPARSAPRAAPA